MMRQLQDFLVWCVLIAMVAAAIYLTPALARYMSDEGQPHRNPPSQRSLAFSPPIHSRDRR